MQEWLPNPKDGTKISVGFDGSDSDDYTAIRCETIDGLQFTPRYGPDDLPTIWNPAEWNGFIPRSEVAAAVDEIFDRWTVARMYCDVKDWASEIGDWSLKYGDEHVFEWRTERTNMMFEEIRRFESDLRSGRIKHDGCPITTVHMFNAIKTNRPGQKYLLAKPNQTQKIDASMASILAHTAAMDAHEKGWAQAQTTAYAYFV